MHTGHVKAYIHTYIALKFANIDTEVIYADANHSVLVRHILLEYNSFETLNATTEEFH